MGFTEQLKEQISNLSKYIRFKVSVTYVEDGKSVPESGELELVDNSSRGGSLRIKVLNEDYTLKHHANLPFLGSFSVAIQRVTDEKGTVLYENRLVDESYSEKTSPDIRKKCGFEPFTRFPPP